MCIGIPGQICAIDGNLAKVEVCGIQREVDLTLVGAVDDRGQPRLGQWVLVHVGFAMAKIDETEALLTLAAVKKLGDAYQTEIDAFDSSAIL